MGEGLITQLRWAQRRDGGGMLQTWQPPLTLTPSSPFLSCFKHGSLLSGSLLSGSLLSFSLLLQTWRHPADIDLIGGIYWCGRNHHQPAAPRNAPVRRGQGLLTRCPVTIVPLAHTSYRRLPSYRYPSVPAASPLLFCSMGLACQASPRSRSNWSW